MTDTQTTEQIDADQEHSHRHKGVLWFGALIVSKISFSSSTRTVQLLRGGKLDTVSRSPRP